MVEEDLCLPALQDPQGRGKLSFGKWGKVFARLKLALIGFVLSNVRC